MAKKIINLNERSEELFNQEKFDEIIELLTDKILEEQNDAELYAS